MGVKVFDMGIVKEWFGTSGEFIKVAMKPGAGAPAGDKAVFTKWIVSAMWCLILCHAVNIAYFALSGGNVVTGVISFVQYAIGAFIQTWIFWFSFAKREPPCCAICIFCLEDIKPMNLIVGLLLVLNGVLQVLGQVTQLLNLLAYITQPATIVWLVFFVVYCLYAVCNLCAGLCLVKLGSKEAGVEVPGAEKIGA